MKKWEPTIGKWKDYENYEMKEPLWKIALNFAQEQYDRAEIYWEYAENHEKKRIPYIVFVQNVLRILIKDTNISDYSLLIVGALARVRELTDCHEEEIKALTGSYIYDKLNAFPQKTSDNLIEYYADVFDRDLGNETMLILLAELLYILRQESCPHADEEENVKYFIEIEELIDTYYNEKASSRQCYLCELIQEQLKRNIGHGGTPESERRREIKI